MTRTGFCYDERCLLHDNGSWVLDERVREWLDVPHPERPERLSLTYALLERSGVLAQLARVPAREATVDELLLVHTERHVDAIRGASARGGVQQVGPEARASEASWQAALLAVGGLLEAVDRVAGGGLANAYVCCRPPGHHAGAEQAMGFCLFNAVAVAARHLQRRHGLPRVAILDWDVHHGNGTQAIFERDGSVLFVSLHQDDLYPKGWGAAGTGGTATVNVPLPPGTGDGGYLLAFDDLVAPALRAFRPDFVLVSAGQDPAAADTHGRMSVTTEGFRALARRARRLAEELCGGRVAVFQEGGYGLEHLPFCNLAVVEGLAELPPSWERDPLELDVPLAVTDDVRRALARAAGTPR